MARQGDDAEATAPTLGLVVTPYDIPRYPARPQKCANAYCTATPIWVILSTLDKHTQIDHVCGTHFQEYVMSAANNMRIRLK